MTAGNYKLWCWSGNQDRNICTKGGQMSQWDRHTQTLRYLDMKIAPYPTGRMVCSLVTQVDTQHRG